MRRLLLFPVLAVGLFALPPTAEAVHADYVTRTWRTEWEECTAVVVNCTDRTMDIEVRRVGSFTIAQQSRILHVNGMGAVNGLDTDDYLRMVDAGTTNVVYTNCLAGRLSDAYNRNTVRWAGEDENYAGITTVYRLADEICFFNIEYYVDTNKWYDWYFGHTGTGSGEAHWLKIVLHEFGHGIGFGIDAPNNHLTDSANCPSNGTNNQEIMCNFWYAGKDYTTFRPSERGVFKHAYS